MSEYNPDKWVIVELKTPTDTLYKVLATWSGDYLHGDSWKLSSGIHDVKKTKNGYEFHNHSGSIYKCRENSYGMNAYTASIFSEMEKRQTNEIKIRVINEDDIKNMTIFVPEKLNA